MEGIMSRLNPEMVYPFQSETDNGGGDKTTFYIKSLTVYQHRVCEELSSEHSRLGESIANILKFGLVGWDNFTYEDGEVIPFSFENMASIPEVVQLEIREKIMELTEVEEDLKGELKTIAKWSDWGSHNNSTQWDCEYCNSKGLAEKRNCDGSQPNTCPSCKTKTFDDVCEACNRKTRPHFRFRFGNTNKDMITRCPISLLTPRAIWITNFVNYSEGISMAPFAGGLLEQTSFFYHVRMIVLSEQNILLKKELDKPIAAK